MNDSMVFKTLCRRNARILSMLIALIFLFGPVLVYSSFFIRLGTLLAGSATTTKGSYGSTYCALDATGHFDEFLEHFHVNDISHESAISSCPWTDFAGAVLRKKEIYLSPENIVQKRRLISEKPTNILLIGDSQERNLLNRFCSVSSDAKLRSIKPRWAVEGSTEIHTSQSGAKTQTLASCKIGKLSIANFFHFGLVGHHNLSYQHVSTEDMEPTETLDRIQNMLPYFVEDAFGPVNETQIDVVVMNSGLWDLLAISTHENWLNEMSTLLSDGTWADKLGEMVEAVRQKIPTSSAIVWRNMPDVIEARTERREYIQLGALTNPFTSTSVEWMNHVGTVTAKRLGLPILDWRGSITGLEEPLMEWDGYHIRGAGLDVYINRILNAVTTARKVDV